MRTLVLATAMLASSVPAAAVITDFSFEGFGRVTYSRTFGDPPFVYDLPKRGTRVTIAGDVHLGASLAVPDDFTGEIELDADQLYSNQASFFWIVNNGFSYGDAPNNSGPAIYNGTISVRFGKLYGVDLYVDNDSDDAAISFTGGRGGRGVWGSTIGRGDQEVGGEWRLYNSVPEPATWAMMLIGFGVIGTGMRRQVSSIA